MGLLYCWPMLHGKSSGIRPFVLESDGRANVGVGGIVVVGIAVVVDIREIRSVASVSRQKPPVVAALKIRE